MIFRAVAELGAARGRFEMDGQTFDCALGRSGVKPAADKREGDGGTPLGVWPMRRVVYRPDRGLIAPALPFAATHPDDGWCDAPDDVNYNRPVTLPYGASAEHMWREDRLYDIVVILGHNDAPPVPRMGSAIFLHLAKPDYGPTEGCVALARPHLEAVLARAAPGDALEIKLG